LHRSEGRDASVWVQSHEAHQQVNFHFVQSRRMLAHLHAAELRESRFEVVQLECIRPVIFIRGSEHLEDFENLINLRIAHEKRSPLDHLCKDAARRPQINTQGVSLLAEEDLGAAVPECDDLVGVGFDRESEGASQAEVSQFHNLAR